MKKGTRGMLVAAGIFASMGIGLCIGGISMAAAQGSGNIVAQAVQIFSDHSYPFSGLIHLGKDEDFSDEDWEEKEGKSTEVAFAPNLEISLKYNTLIFQEYTGDVIKVDTLNDTKGDIVTKENSGKITITDTRKGTIGQHKAVRVQIPSGKVFDSVKLSVDAGTIEMSASLNTDQFSVEVGVGEFTNSGDITAKLCDLQVGAGTIEISQVDTQKLSADCGTGEINLLAAGKEQDYNYELTCGMGNIDLGDSQYGGFGIEKTISNDGATRKMVLECGMGDIQVDFAK